ncbi:hypothetical protein QYE87_24295, partial [Enterobacter hormaechei subsp. steigerwaltii]|nr:hypothetical protein [Enterobacter hormaechei subsp. steigerwaltii]
FRDACQGGGAYGKTASPWPSCVPVKYLPGIFQEISAPPVSRYRSPQPVFFGGIMACTDAEVVEKLLSI